MIDFQGSPQSRSFPSEVLYGLLLQPELHSFVPDLYKENASVPTSHPQSYGEDHPIFKDAVDQILDKHLKRGIFRCIYADSDKSLNYD